MLCSQSLFPQIRAFRITEIALPARYLPSLHDHPGCGVLLLYTSLENLMFVTENPGFEDSQKELDHIYIFMKPGARNVTIKKSGYLFAQLPVDSIKPDEVRCFTVDTKEDSPGPVDKSKRDNAFNDTLAKYLCCLGIRTVPPDCDVLINGQKLQGYANLVVEPGSYKIEASRPGYYRREETLELDQCEKVNRVYKLTAIPDSSKLSIGALLGVSFREQETQLYTEHDPAWSVGMTGHYQLGSSFLGFRADMLYQVHHFKSTTVWPVGDSYNADFSFLEVPLLMTFRNDFSMVNRAFLQNPIYYYAGVSLKFLLNKNVEGKTANSDKEVSGYSDGETKALLKLGFFGRYSLLFYDIHFSVPINKQPYDQAVSLGFQLGLYF